MFKKYLIVWQLIPENCFLYWIETEDRCFQETIEECHGKILGVHDCLSLNCLNDKLESMEHLDEKKLHTVNDATIIITGFAL